MVVANGVFPRLNASMCLSGKYEGTLISVVGKFHGPQQFQCSDGALIQLITDHLEQAQDMDMSGQGSALELVGQWMEGRLTVRNKLKQR
jgi:hypothetical protein